MACIAEASSPRSLAERIAHGFGSKTEERRLDHWNLVLGIEILMPANASDHCH